MYGGELEKAVVNAPRGLYWDEKTRRLVGGAGDTLLDPYDSGWFVPHAAVSRCEKGEIIIFRYGKGDR